MPEIPELVYIRRYLDRCVIGKTVTGVHIHQPVVLRNMLGGSVEEALVGRSIEQVAQHGPFLRIGMNGALDIVINLMLAGKLQHCRPGEKAEGYACVSWDLQDGTSLRLCDEKKMAKLYIARHEDLGRIPRYFSQGIDVLSPAFTLERFRELVHTHSRKQVRVMINDHSVLSAIGNAYADEILFEARIHPKTFTARLGTEEVDRLYHAIHDVLAWGIRSVDEAAEPIHVKVRTHLKVRNRKGEPCPRCGATIRREGVRGHDVFFCPECQKASRKLFIDWQSGGAGRSSPRSS